MYAKASKNISAGYNPVRSKRTYDKEGQVSKKAHVAKGQGAEHYLQHRHEMLDSVNGAPEPFERRYSNRYRKTSLPI